MDARSLLEELLSFCRDASVAAARARRRLSEVARGNKSLRREVEMLEAQELYLRLLVERVSRELERPGGLEDSIAWALRVVDRIKTSIPLAGELKERLDSISEKLRLLRAGRA